MGELGPIGAELNVQGTEGIGLIARQDRQRSLRRLLSGSSARAETQQGQRAGGREGGVSSASDETRAHMGQLALRQAWPSG